MIGEKLLAILTLFALLFSTGCAGMDGGMAETPAPSPLPTVPNMKPEADDSENPISTDELIDIVLLDEHVKGWLWHNPPIRRSFTKALELSGNMGELLLRDDSAIRLVEKLKQLNARWADEHKDV